MKLKGLSLIAISLLTLPGYATTPLVPLGSASFGRILEREIARDLSEKTLSQLKVVVPTPAKDLVLSVFYPSAAQVMA